MTALLEVKNLTTYFHTRNGVVKAVDDVSFTVKSGETLAIVGESGSGKSVSCYSMLGLIPSPPGRIEAGEAWFDGRDLLKASQAELRQIRGSKIAMIFQDPMTSLNPYLTVGEQLIEPLIFHHKLSRAEAAEKARSLLQEVGIRDPEKTYHAWPHEFSGGMRQRVMIAMALIAEPKLLIADEPTTALDVTIQKQILELVKEIQQHRDIGVIFISHDLAVVKDLADQVVVMKTGRVVERGDAPSIFNCPDHDYTKKLLAAIPAGSKASAHDTAQMSHPLLSVNNLVTTFADRHSGDRFKAVDDISFELQRGEILGLVGESGSGKSTLGRSVLKLAQSDSGSIVFDGEEIQDLTAKAMRPYRRRMQMIFQDPYASLNPRMTIYDTLAEPLVLHDLAKGPQLNKAVLELMDDVGLARAYVRKYPHEFSGGQRQRIAIGRAIATKPELVIADEPVSALDVTIQKQILELILHLVDKHHLSMLFISHDLAVVRVLCDRVMVMKQGRVVESGLMESVWSSPQHDYTEALLKAAP
ncbi:ABC transporter ATP-binding protein [Marinibactrum halimedae]|uniref:ABC-type dipeptide transporter n=1 Tax=Marinibactrum halimedae TaxID=1444977 RepID=A0AA37T8S2_9GAMM|nr:dipeptide ABC transporter ATP-binding protein [Marinibactrum halimedae]MCD9457394.1 oligopeptide ABC transporter ATP-binding protein OppD [Marinibactrum halimedae]GLS25555.1 peptide ABC transporter ATP-binding protein [Marinibactrum halimedae]